MRSPTCTACNEALGTIKWGDMLAQTHGHWEWRCDVCALETQLEYAGAQSARVPALVADLEAAKRARVLGQDTQ